jgi:magnesium-transporting ATPase (P-type)
MENRGNFTFWSLPFGEVLRNLQTFPQGLVREEARRRLEQEGANQLKPSPRSTSLSLFLAPFKSPIILILIAGLPSSFFLWIGGIIWLYILAAETMKKIFYRRVKF